MLNKFGMEDAKPIRTPMAANGHLDLNENGEPVDQKVYILVYDECLLSTYRPDIMFIVCICARFQASPKECHLTAAMKGILTYLKRIHIVLFVVPKRCTIWACGVVLGLGLAGWKVDKRSTSGTCKLLEDHLCHSPQRSKTRLHYQRRPRQIVVMRNCYGWEQLCWTMKSS